MSIYIQVYMQKYLKIIYLSNFNILFDSLCVEDKSLKKVHSVQYLVLNIYDNLSIYDLETL